MLTRRGGVGRLEKRVPVVDADERVIRGRGKQEGAKCWRSLEGNGERGDIDYVYGDNAMQLRSFVFTDRAWTA